MGYFSINMPNNVTSNLKSKIRGKLCYGSRDPTLDIYFICVYGLSSH